MRLGATVVYADFSKIIICTKKSRAADALGYVEYITHSMKNKELFHSIDIKVNQYWEYLMWLDVVSWIVTYCLFSSCSFSAFLDI